MTHTSPLPQRSTASFRPSHDSGRRAVAMSRPVAVAIGLATLALLGWAGASTYYILFRDEVAQRFFAHETELRFTYEDRIADLGNRLARELTAGMVERTGFNDRAEALAARLQDMEVRQARLQALAERVGALTGTAAAALPLLPAGTRAASNERDPATTGSIKPAPLVDGSSLRLREPSEPATSGGSSRDRLSAIGDRLGALEGGELPLAKSIARVPRERLARLRSAILATGLDIDRRGAAAKDGGVGGPLVPWPEGKPLGAFGLLAADIDTDLGEVARLQRAARALPLGQPIAGPLEETSPFGYRQDPFTRTPALHTGVDFRIEYGGTVRATASGRVSVAEYSGGYGNLIEIDHGNGVATRYGHLSAYLVAPGDKVEAGQAIGRAGSTGRSTGAHVHYETRINGEPVNPVRFLQAGQLLGPDRG